jgi:hypothetical protein
MPVAQNAFPNATAAARQEDPQLVRIEGTWAFIYSL